MNGYGMHGCVCVVCAYACDRENGPAGGGKASQIALSKADNVNPLCNERHSGIASSTIEKSIRVDLSFRLLSLSVYFSVRMNTLISEIIRATSIKFDSNVSKYCENVLELDHAH